MSDSGILAEEFLLGQKDLQDLEDLDSSEASYNDKVDSCKKHFNRAAVLVNRLSVFSSNEDIDEINTTDLRLVTLYQTLLPLQCILNINLCCYFKISSHSVLLGPSRTKDFRHEK
jgi:hypothetical protein